MRWMSFWIIAAVVLAIFVYPFPATTQHFARVVYPAPGIGDALKRRLEARDWPRELASVGLQLSRSSEQDLNEALAGAEVLVQDASMTVEIKARTTSSMLFRDGLPEIRAASEVIAAMLELDAMELSYSRLDANGRRNLLWRMHGAGFDDVERAFLAQVLDSEQDPEVRAMADRLEKAINE